MKINLKLTDSQVDKIVYKDLVRAYYIHKDLSGDDELAKALSLVIDYYSSDSVNE